MEVKIVKDVLEANNFIAQKIRRDLATRKITMANIIGSPGAGKTSLILKTIESIKVKIAVIEGDIASDIDAKKIVSRGIPAVQINTGGSCHLNAPMIEKALEEMPKEEALVFVENVGNLVCPASFDIGEDFKVALTSVSEGDDKPYKYPAIFQRAEVIVLNKIDLIDHVAFRRDYFYNGVRTLNPDGAIFEVSALTGEGIGEWSQWLERRFKEKLAG